MGKGAAVWAVEERCGGHCPKARAWRSSWACCNHGAMGLDPGAQGLTIVCDPLPGARVVAVPHHMLHGLQYKSRQEAAVQVGRW